MNVFGVFTFGSLIKTFIPGLVWLVAGALLWRHLNVWYPAVFPAWPFAATDAPTILVVAIPCAILLGLMSNIVVFMGVNDWLVRAPFGARAPELHRLRAALTARIRTDYWNDMALGDATLAPSFMQFADAELLMLKTTGINELLYVREQYWYHLEFQMNMALATLGMLIVLLTSPPAVGPQAALNRDVAECLVLGGACILFYRAALKNYGRHVEKMCTLMAANLHERAVAARSAPATAA